MSSHKYSKTMHILVLMLINLFFNTSNGESGADSQEAMSVHNMSDAFLAAINAAPSDRINELKQKLADINKYVINNENVNKLLLNVTRETSLNETNFFKSLTEDDHFRFISKDEPKNLYLKLKEKVTRDDVLKILDDKKHADVIVRSARKAIGGGDFGRSEKQVIDDVVDKMIAETPRDQHHYRASINDSIYWDPQPELEELRDHFRRGGRRLYRGERTNVRYYPFMASVHIMGRFWCGGALYWHDIVLTSASCLQLMHNNRFFRENPKILEVRIGSNHSRIGGEIIDALEVYFHPGYNPKTLNNNIALIRLRRHLYFNYHRLPKIIGISHNEGNLPDTAEVLLLGWGVTKMTQKLSYEPIFLQRKVLPVYPSKFCKEVYGDKFVTSTMFCAGTMTTGEGACDHDAGGPAVLAGKLVGIISFGPTVCGYPNAPTVFTRVGAYADWIETINETMPSYYRGRKRTTTTTPSPLLDMLERWPRDMPRLDNLAYITPPSMMLTASSSSPPSPIPTSFLRHHKNRDDDTREGFSTGDISDF